jgi:hypothetical protein
VEEPCGGRLGQIWQRQRCSDRDRVMTGAPHSAVGSGKWEWSVGAGKVARYDSAWAFIHARAGFPAVRSVVVNSCDEPCQAVLLHYGPCGPNVIPVEPTANQAVPGSPDGLPTRVKYSIAHALGRSGLVSCHVGSCWAHPMDC